MTINPTPLEFTTEPPFDIPPSIPASLVEDVASIELDLTQISGFEDRQIFVRGCGNDLWHTFRQILQDYRRYPLDYSIAEDGRSIRISACQTLQTNKHPVTNPIAA